MANFFCLKCGHEFPAEGAKMKPDRTGFIIFTSIGALGLLFAAVCFGLFASLSLDRGFNFLWYGVLAGAAGLGAIGIGLGLRKGAYAYCPSCGKAMALPSESNSAKYEKRKRGLGG